MATCMPVNLSVPLLFKYRLVYFDLFWNCDFVYGKSSCTVMPIFCGVCVDLRIGATGTVLENCLKHSMKFSLFVE